MDLGAQGGSILCQKDSFLCAARGIEIEVAFTKKLGTGLFGGEGFILQRLPLSRLADRIIEASKSSYVQAGGQRKD